MHWLIDDWRRLVFLTDIMIDIMIDWPTVVLALFPELDQRTGHRKRICVFHQSVPLSHTRVIDYLLSSFPANHWTAEGFLELFTFLTLLECAKNASSFHSMLQSENISHVNENISLSPPILEPRSPMIFFKPLQIRNRFMCPITVSDTLYLSIFYKRMVVTLRPVFS